MNFYVSLDMLLSLLSFCCSFKVNNIMYFNRWMANGSTAILVLKTNIIHRVYIVILSFMLSESILRLSG